MHGVRRFKQMIKVKITNTAKLMHTILSDFE